MRSLDRSQKIVRQNNWQVATLYNAEVAYYFIHPFIHFLYRQSVGRVSRGLEPIPAIIGRKAGYTLDRSLTDTVEEIIEQKYVKFDKSCVKKIFTLTNKIDYQFYIKIMQKITKKIDQDKN